MHHSSPRPPSSGILAQIVLPPTPVFTLCRRAATRSADVFTVGEVTCRECKRRWQIDTGQRAHPTLEANPEYIELKNALKSGKMRIADVFAAAGRRFGFGGSSVAQQMPVFQLLVNLPCFAPEQANSILKELRIAPGDSVGTLSEMSRGKILAKINV